MNFPVYFHILGYRIHPHPVMESIAYCVGFQLYRVLRKRWHIQHAGLVETIWMIIAGLTGALLGSKLLAWAESFHFYWAHRTDPHIFLSGKTIVGGLAGGWLGIDLAKKALGVRVRTGDVFVFPLILAIAIGRVGCFLTGLEDQTCGVPTSLPWGIDFGDSIPRHPTQLYEILFLLLLGSFLLWRMRKPYVNGELFRLFILAYFSWRTSIDWIKPQDPADLVLGMGAIQWVAAAGALLALRGVIRPPESDRLASMASEPAPLPSIKPAPVPETDAVR